MATGERGQVEEEVEGLRFELVVRVQRLGSEAELGDGLGVIEEVIWMVGGDLEGCGWCSYLEGFAIDFHHFCCSLASS